MNTLEEVLAHYGVKGQRWGVRRKRGPGGRVGTEKTQFSKSPNKLSNAEIDRRIKRLEKEKQYNKLNAPTKSKGREAAEEILAGTGKKVAKTVATTTATVAVKVALDRFFSSGLASEVAKRL